MTDLLLSPLATEWRGYSLHTDFRPMIRYTNMLLRLSPEEIPAEMEVAANALFCGHNQGPQILQHRLDGLSWFFTGGDTDPVLQEASKKAQSYADGPKITLDYHADAALIVAAFQQVYGIDLTTAQIHWWRFRALLEGLPEDCTLSRVRAIRGEDVNKIADAATRERYITLQEQLALPKDIRLGGVMYAQTLADHDAAFLARFQH